MTNREFYVAIVNANLGEEITTKANELISAIDTKNAKAQEKRMEKSKADEPLFESVVAYIKANDKALANELAKALDISTSKAVSLANKLVENGTLKVERVKISKVGERNQYQIA